MIERMRFSAIQALGCLERYSKAATRLQCTAVFSSNAKYCERLRTSSNSVWTLCKRLLFIIFVSSLGITVSASSSVGQVGIDGLSNCVFTEETAVGVNVLKDLFYVYKRYTSKQLEEDQSEYEEEMQEAVRLIAYKHFGKGWPEQMTYQYVVDKLIGHLVPLDYKEIVSGLDAIGAGSQYALRVPLLLCELVKVGEVGDKSSDSQQSRSISDKYDTFCSFELYNSIAEWAFGITCSSEDEVMRFFRDLKTVVTEPWDSDLICKTFNDTMKRNAIKWFKITVKSFDPSKSGYNRWEKEMKCNDAGEKAVKNFLKGVKKMRDPSHKKKIWVKISFNHPKNQKIMSQRNAGFIIILEIMRKWGVKEAGVFLGSRHFFKTRHIDDLVVAYHDNFRKLPDIREYLPTCDIKYRFTMSSSLSYEIHLDVNHLPQDILPRLHLEISYSERFLDIPENVEECVSDAKSIKIVFLINPWLQKDNEKALCNLLKELSSLKDFRLGLDIKYPLKEDIPWIETLKDAMDESLSRESLTHESLPQKKLSCFSVMLHLKKHTETALKEMRQFLQSLVDSAKSQSNLKSLDAINYETFTVLQEHVREIVQKYGLRNLSISTDGRFLYCCFWCCIPEPKSDTGDIFNPYYCDTYYYIRDICLDETNFERIATLSNEGDVNIGELSFSKNFSASLKEDERSAFLKKLEKIRVRTLLLHDTSLDELTLSFIASVMPSAIAFNTVLFSHDFGHALVNAKASASLKTVRRIEVKSLIFEKTGLDKSVATFLTSVMPEVVMFDNISLSDDFLYSLKEATKTKANPFTFLKNWEKIKIRCSNTERAKNEEQLLCPETCVCRRLLNALIPYYRLISRKFNICITQ